MRRVRLATLGLIALTAGAGRGRADWEVKRTGARQRLVGALREALRRDPHDARALARLVSESRGGEAALERDLLAAPSPNRADLVAAGHLARLRGDDATAANRFQAALARQPNDSRTRLALADAERRLHRDAQARRDYEAVLPALACGGPRAPCAPVLRALADLARDAGEGEATRAALVRLCALDPADADTRRELAELLAAGGRVDEAIRIWRALADRPSTSPRERSAAWARIGVLAAGQGDTKMAGEAYERALGSAAGDARPALREARIRALAGAEGELRAWLARQERQPPARRDDEAWMTIVRLHEALGETAAAVLSARAAIAAHPRATAMRERLITLLDGAGRAAEADAERSELAALAPDDSRLQLALADRLADRGAPGRQEALARLHALSARRPDDRRLHAKLAHRFDRLGEPDAALREEERALALDPEDDELRIAVAERWFGRGARERASAVLRAVPAQGADAARRVVRMAEVLADRGEIADALRLYEAAIAQAPDDAAPRRGLALLCERTGRRAEAEAAWTELFRRAGRAHDVGARTEAARAVARLITRAARPSERLAALERRAFGPPLDGDALLLLSQAQREIGRVDEAERTLSTLAGSQAPAPVRADALEAAAQLSRARQRPEEAIAALDAAARLDPQHAGDRLLLLAELAEELRQDDRALDALRRAAALTPDDPKRLVRLARAELRRGDESAARRAIDRAAASGFPPARRLLAELLLRAGDPGAAEKTYRALALDGSDEMDVLDAGRRALALAERLGTLPALEAAAALTVASEGMARTRPGGRFARRLLLEALEREAAPLRQAADGGDGAALRSLGGIAARGLAFATAALEAGDPSEAHAAVALLERAGGPGAAGPLLRFAARGPSRGDASYWAAHEPSSTLPLETRILAAATGALLADAALVPELSQLAAGPEKRIRLAGLAGLARIATPAMVPSVARALDDEDPALQAAACLAIAQGLERPRAAGLAPGLFAGQRLRLLERIGAPDSLVRAACALALGTVDAGEGGERLRARLADKDPLVRAAAARALGARGDRAAIPALLSVLLRDEDPWPSSVAAAALADLVAPASAKGPESRPRALGIAWTTVTDLQAEARRLASPKTDAAKLAPPAGVPSAEVLAALGRALGGPPGVALRALSRLPVPGPGHSKQADAHLADGVSGLLVDRARDVLADERVRAASLRALAARDRGLAAETAAACSAEPSPRVRRAAAAVLAAYPDPSVAPAAQALRRDPLPSVRAAAAGAPATTPSP